MYTERSHTSLIKIKKKERETKKFFAMTENITRRETKQVNCTISHRFDPSFTHKNKKQTRGKTITIRW